jgi:S1-C subfamily serine protease
LKDIAQSKEKEKVTNQYAGTGFLVSRNGYVATSYHVVKDADSIYIENENFGSLKADIVFSDPTNDVSILKIDRKDFMLMNSLPFIVSNDEANIGEAAFTLGFPREDIVFGEGSVSASTGYLQNANAYQVSVPVNPGNSGGPLFNARGDLIGMISGIQTETSGATFAIKSNIILNICQQTPIDSLSEPLVLPQRNALRYMSRVDQIKKWREYVFIVRVYKN